MGAKKRRVGPKMTVSRLLHFAKDVWIQVRKGDRAWQVEMVPGWTRDVPQVQIALGLGAGAVIRPYSGRFNT